LLPLHPWCSVSNPSLSLVSFRTPCSWDIPRGRSIATRTLFPMNIEVPTKYQLSHNDRIVVFVNGLHSENPMLYRPTLHGNCNALGLVRRASRTNSPRQQFHSQLCYQIVRYFCRTLYYNLHEDNLKHVFRFAIPKIN
jgi:hypothetical protein